MASIQKRGNGRWRARYRDPQGKEHARHFARRIDAQRWLDDVTATLVVGTYVDPKLRELTVEAWADRWMHGYESNRASTVQQARVHMRRIVDRFGPFQLGSIRPSDVRAWMSELKTEGLADSTRYALHGRRFAHLMSDAVHDGLIPRSPLSRRTSPGAPKQRPYVATTNRCGRSMTRCRKG